MLECNKKKWAHSGATLTIQSFAGDNDMIIQLNCRNKPKPQDNGRFLP